MNPHQLFETLKFIDEVHNYLQFLLPLGIYVFFKKFNLNKIILNIFTAISILLIALEITAYNQIQFFSSIGQSVLAIPVVSFSAVVIYLCLLLPIMFFVIFQKFAAYSVKLVFEKIVLFLLAFFFLTQSLLGGCFIHFVENYLALKYLRIDNWHPLEVFGSDFLPAIFLRILYLGFGLVACYTIFIKDEASNQTLHLPFFKLNSPHGPSQNKS